jgi:hypothetical protein
MASTTVEQLDLNGDSRSMASTPVEQLDLNKDGAASKTEIMQEFDSNNDGTISSREFAQHTLETPGKQRLRIHGYGVNKCLWNCYKFTQTLAIPIFLIFYGLYYHVSTSIVLDSNPSSSQQQFYLHQLIKDRLIEQPFTDSDGEHGTIFLDIRNTQDLWIWVESVFSPYVAPSVASDAMYLAYELFEIKPITIDGLLTLPYAPVFYQARAESPYLDIDQPKRDDWVLEKMIKNHSCTKATAIEGCDTCEPWSSDDVGPSIKTKSCGCKAWSSGVFEFKAPPTPINFIGKDGKSYLTEGYTFSLPVGHGTQVGDLGSVDNVLAYSSHCSTQRLLFMSKNSWIDQSTRLVTVSFCATPFTSTTETLPAMNRPSEPAICFRAVFDIDRYGLVSPSYNTYMGTRYLLASNEGYYKRVFSFTTVVFPIYFLFVELIEMAIRQKRYCRKEEAIWNWFDLIIAVTCMAFGLNFSITPFEVADQIQFDASDNDQIFHTFEALMANRSWMFYAGLINFFSTIKLIRVVSLRSSHSRLPVLTIFRSMWDSVPFLIFLLLWMFGLGLFFNLSFGSIIPSFRSVGSSLITILKMLLGDIDFDQYEGTEIYIEAPILISFFSIMTLYFILTMFVSIIDNAYQETKSKLDKEEARKKNNLVRIEYVDWYGSLLHKHCLKNSKAYYKCVTWCWNVDHDIKEVLGAQTELVEVVESEYVVEN